MPNAHCFARCVRRCGGSQQHAAIKRVRWRGRAGLQGGSQNDSCAFRGGGRRCKAASPKTLERIGKALSEPCVELRAQGRVFLVSFFSGAARGHRVTLLVPHQAARVQHGNTGRACMDMWSADFNAKRSHPCSHPFSSSSPLRCIPYPHALHALFAHATSCVPKRGDTTLWAVQSCCMALKSQAVRANALQLKWCFGKLHPPTPPPGRRSRISYGRRLASWPALVTLPPSPHSTSSPSV